eukprot:TRINITY_DN10319_c0_g1_i1.p1 TRINITY_DN10319_c0_g1~~TRINITY_DN10319_c0_g1_i1.p1  ORF type:complete len:260 (+),score=62.36 TRINITY_DN10319_c0_g1_i1:64-843(+)
MCIRDRAYIIQSINEAFDEVEFSFLEIAKAAYNVGFAAAGRAGSCALVCVVHNNKVYVANSGDCMGMLLKEGPNGTMIPIKATHKFNASSKKEQARLTQQFQNEKDIFVCRPGSEKACYVKNRLQPTRSFGDFGLKYSEFNNPQKKSGLNRHITDFTGPYINHRPDIKTFTLDKSDRYLIIGTDGLWDELRREDIANIVQQNKGKNNELGKVVMDSALKHAADKSKISVEEMGNIPPGSKRRSIHDDITFIIADLQNQA